jgi:hypothetical protein
VDPVDITAPAGTDTSVTLYITKSDVVRISTLIVLLVLAIVLLKTGINAPPPSRYLAIMLRLFASNEHDIV